MAQCFATGITSSDGEQAEFDRDGSVAPASRKAV